MCGIVGYIGTREAGDILLDGLKRLEYRGYDSSGMAVIDGGEVSIRRSTGKLENLTSLLAGDPLKGSTGIGHTRWATHGRPSEENAHPHLEGGIAVVHNGIIENYLSLKESLKGEGVTFKSETDTEVICHLICRHKQKGLGIEEAVKEALKELSGSYALAVISEDEPGLIVAARQDCPLVVGLSGGENFLASDITAILNYTRRVIFLDDGEMALIGRESIEVKGLDGAVVEKSPQTVDWSPAMAEKGGYRHFMLKEIVEQPRAITDTFRGAVLEEAGDVIIEDFEINEEDIERIYIVACGTSWHAGLVGKFLLEEFCAIPTEVDLGSEFRYRNPLVGKNTLIIAISQSGETADTLAAVREAKRRGASLLSICNVVGSSLPRDSDCTVYTHAGPEIGVASTKAFTTQLTALYLLAVMLGRRRGKISAEVGCELIQELVRLPGKIETMLEGESAIEAIARKYFHFRDFLYLGRGLNYPIALEGALKLKEISYIHAEGYPAGEMKHGPIALIDEDMPVVVLAPGDETYPKMLSNMEESKARDGRIIAIVNEGDKDASSKADDVIIVPRASRQLTPILMTIPLQLLAYHIAVLKGTDVDQPRNLAKSVTVE